MSSLSYQDQNELYEQITEQLASGRSEPKVFGINRIKVEIAERLVAKVPVLLQKEYKDHLLMAVDLKFQELREEIFRHDRDQQHAESEIRSIQSQLVAMGVVRAERLVNCVPF
jgi:hypothetical protein